MSTWLIRDKTLVGLQNLLQISKDHGFTMEDRKHEPESFSLTLIALCEKLEHQNQLLNHLLIKKTSCESSVVSDALQKCTKIHSNCQSVFKDLKDRLESLLESRNLIADLLNKPQEAGTIKIDIKYQIPASRFLTETRDELLSFEENIKKIQDLIEYIEKKNLEKNTYEKEVTRFYENLEKSVDELLKFHENLNKF